MSGPIGRQKIQYVIAGPGSRLATKRGIRVGSSVAQLEHAYGALPGFGMNKGELGFVAEGGKVTSIRLGMWNDEGEEVPWFEYCQR